MELKHNIQDTVWAMLSNRATEVRIVGRTYHQRQYKGESKVITRQTYQVVPLDMGYAPPEFTCEVLAEGVFKTKQELIASL